MVRYVNDNPSGLSYIAVQTSPARADPEPECEPVRERWFDEAWDTALCVMLGLVFMVIGYIAGIATVLRVALH